MDQYKDPKNVNISCEICVNMCSSWSQMSIFHLNYVQMCPGYKLFQNVNISFEICVNMFTADPKC